MKNGSQIKILVEVENVGDIIQALATPTFSIWRCADGDGVAIKSEEVSHMYYKTSTGQDVL